MAQFEHMPEIDTSLRTFIIGYTALNSLVSGRVFYYRPSNPEGQQPEVPFIFFKRAGGVYGNYRYYFSVRASSPAELATIRRMLLKRMMSPIVLASGESVTEAYLDGQVSDTADESFGWYESSFYMMLEMLEAQYG